MYLNGTAYTIHLSAEREEDFLSWCHTFLSGKCFFSEKKNFFFFGWLAFIEYPLMHPLYAGKVRCQRSVLTAILCCLRFSWIRHFKKLKILTQKQWRQNQASSTGHEGKWILLYRSLLQEFLQVIQKYIFQ